jgi:exopolysaccharide biosynthesis predicted pyruvyltransferase EpsI
MQQEIDKILKDWLPPEGKLIYYPNPGNAGDALIATATWQCFDRVGINPLVCRPERFPRDSTVILGGGGNLVPPYPQMASALQACLNREIRSCLLLPHTIRGNETLLARLDKRFTLLCRDQSTLDHVRRHAPQVHARLLDDMALGLDLEALRHRTQSLSHQLRLLVDRRWRKRRRRWKRALLRQHHDANGRLEILRADAEAKTEPGESREKDLMDHFLTRCEKRAGCDQVSMDLIQLLGSSKSVSTDRLHVALPAILLGLPVEILDNNYGKLSAVWETSLRGRFPNARLAEATGQD